MKKHYKVRRHLANGPNYGKWQIKCSDKEVETVYVENSLTILLFGCILKNRTSTSQRIFDGASKTVCAWAQCDSYILCEVMDSGWKALDDADYYDFNPRNHPTWLDSYGVDADGRDVAVIVTDQNTLVNGEQLTTLDVYTY